LTLTHGGVVLRRQLDAVPQLEAPGFLDRDEGLDGDGPGDLRGRRVRFETQFGAPERAKVVQPPLGCRGRRRAGWFARRQADGPADERCPGRPDALDLDGPDDV